MDQNCTQGIKKKVWILGEFLKKSQVDFQTL